MMLSRLYSLCLYVGAFMMSTVASAQGDVCFQTSGETSGFHLSVETHATDGVTGLTTYRLYMNTPDSTDFVSAVIGDSATPAFLRSTTSFYQHSSFEYVTPGGINPILYGIFPELEYDSWVTIGIDDQADLGAGETVIATIADPNIASWITTFQSGGDIEMNTTVGGGWYILPTSANGIAGADKKVLLAQLTTDGEISGQLFIQVFPNGDQANKIDNSYAFSTTDCPCTDTDADGVCDEDEVSGCTDSAACNYDASATDDNGSCTLDTTPPNFTFVPSDVTIECGEDVPSDMATAEHTCSDVTVTMTESTSGDGCSTAVIQTFTATDDFGNTATASRTVSVVDSVWPAFDAPADLTINCGDSTDPASTGDVTSWTDCNAVTSTYTDGEAWEMDDCTLSIIARTWTLTDACGNSFNNIQLITVLDNAAPVFTDVPADQTLECGDALPVSDAVASDDCGSLTMSQSDATSEGECTGESYVTRTFTATDDCGNSTTATQVFHIVDTTAPEFSSVPADVTIQVGEDLPTDLATATDGCSNPTVLLSDASDVSNTQTVITRTFTAVDACGNDATATQTITILEFMGCMDAAACNFDNAATAENGSCEYCSCDGISPTFNGISLELESAFEHTEGDLAGQTTYRLYVHTPNATDFISSVTGDAVNPTRVQTSTSFYQHALGGANAQSINEMLVPTFPQLAYDSWVSIGQESQADGAAGEIETSTVEGLPWIAGFEAGGDLMITDAVGGGWYTLNGASNGVAGSDQRVLVGQFTTDGEIHGQLYVQVFPEGNGQNMIFEMLRFGEPACGCQDPVACTYEADATYSDADQCLYPVDLYGNALLDCDGVCTVPGTPVMTDVPADVSLACGHPIPSDGPSATDGCGAVEITTDNQHSGDGCNGSILQTFTATDAFGNSTSATRTITFYDNDAPVYTGPVDVTVNCGESLDPANTGDVSEWTDCNEVTVEHSDLEAWENDDCTSALIVRTWTLTDACGNYANHIQLITVMDAAAPLFTDVPADMDIECDQDVPASSATATDDCGSVSMSQSDETVAGDCTGELWVYRTFVAVDVCGNSTSVTQTFHIVDTTAPEFSSVPADVTIMVGDALPTDEAFASDNCTSTTLSSSDASAVEYTQTVITRTFSATDECGNTATAIQTITVLEYMGCTDSASCNYDPTATADDGLCEYCSCSGIAPTFSGISLEIDTLAYHTEGDLAGLTTYRVYVKTPTTSDFLSAVTGDASNPLRIQTTTSFYQHMLGSTSAQGINPMLLIPFPELVYDSWVTVGLQNQSNSALGEVDVSLIEGAPWIADFNAGGDIVIEDAVGGGWYTLNGASNGVSGYDQRVLVGQFTTDGTLHGQIFVQVFPEGDGENMVFETLHFGTPNCGCSDAAACNYNPDAEFLDASQCLYPEDYFGVSNVDCDGNCVNDTDGDGVCDEDEVPGCMDNTACNFDDAATDDSGTCMYPPVPYNCDGSCANDQDNDGICDEFEVQGCTYDSACNYDADATENDGSCDFDSCRGCTDAGAFNYDADATIDDGSCLFGGCTDSAASNYDDSADFNDGSCTYPGCTNAQACNYDPSANQDDGSCDTTSCAGCTNSIACNYDLTATMNDGSCEFFSCRGCIDPLAFNYDGDASIDDGSCIYGGCTDSSALNYDDTADFNDGSCLFGGCIDLTACNFDATANTDDGSCDFTSCAGCMITFACNYDPTAIIQDDAACDFYTCCGDENADNYTPGTPSFLTVGCTYDGTPPSVNFTGCELDFACNFGSDDPCEFSSCSGCMTPGSCNYDAAATIPLTCLSAEDLYGVTYLDCDGNCINDVNSNGQCDETETSGCTNPLACNYTDGATLDDGSCDMLSCLGCTDALACNFDPAASINDGSCDYSSCFGCMEETACNYDDSATSSDGSCTYPASIYEDCAGNCFNDSNSNGLCDETETTGCTNPTACNFALNATFDDGSCEYTSCAGCTDAVACNYDASATLSNGSCDYTSCAGCTDAVACNYDGEALLDDSSCEYATTYYNCAGECLGDADGDGVCDGADLTYNGCNDALACNFNADADTDDGSCDFCSCAGMTTTDDNYGLEIEEVVVDGIPGYVTYRVYVTLPNATDQVSAITGESQHPTFVETTGDFYQDLVGSTFPNSVNPLMLETFPSLQYDSWFTIGIDQAPDVGLEQGSIQGLPEPEPWSSVFEGGSGFAIDDVIGSGWFVNPGVSNGVAGDDHRVLIAQLTTNGVLSGQFYVQIFPEGNNLNQERVTLGMSDSQCGCTDVAACNFAPGALFDDESCFYAVNGYDCDDDCLFDNEAPTYDSAPVDVTVSCGDDMDFMPVFTDNCDADVDVVVIDETTIGDCAGSYDILRKYVATDDFGYQTDTLSHVIHVVDLQAPIFTDVPASMTLTCGESLPTLTATAEDNCSGVTLSSSDVWTDSDCTGFGVWTRTFTAVDGCGNTANAVTTYTIADNDAPAIVDVPANLTLGCGEAYDFPVPSATDACSAVTFTEVRDTVLGVCANDFSVTRTFTFTDACGNTSAAFQFIEVSDIEAPELLGVPANLTMSCGDAIVEPTVTAADGCGGDVSIDMSETTTATVDCAYDLLRTYTATDACGNVSSEVWTVTFVDDSAPTFTAPADVTIDCSDSTDPASTGEVNDAFDLCTSGPSITYNDAVGNGSFSLEGLTADIRVDLTVNNLMNFPRTFEATGVTLGAGIELTEADETSNPFLFRGALEVDVDGSVIHLNVVDVVDTESLDYIQVTLSNISGNPGIVGAVLSSDNINLDASQADVTTEWTGNSVTVTWSETDGGDMQFAAGGSAQVDLSGANNCISQNVIERTWTATDACGNTSSAVQTITSLDMTAPVFDMVPADLTLDCSASYDIVMATASDACSGATVEVLESHDYPCDGTDVMTLTFTATDGCGNVSTAMQTVTFEDTTAPVFTSTPLDQILDCSEALPASDVETSDDCGAVSVEQADVMLSGDCAGSYQIERTFTATDACGNSASYMQTFTFTDNNAPVVSDMPADTTVTMAVGTPMYLELPTAEDACGSASISYVDLCINVTPGGYETSRVFTITDDCGNSVEMNQSITVVFTGGCTNPVATNYDATVMIDDGTCLLGGCTDSEAVNFNPLADVDDGSCIVVSIEGCTDAAACNFHPAANTEDGSCDYCSCADALSVDGYSLDMETYAVDGIDGTTTYRLYVTTANVDDFVSSVAGETGFETYIRTSTSFYQDALGGALGQNTQSALFSIQPSLEYDSYVTIGLSETADLAGGEGAVTTAESVPWVAPFEDGGDVEIGGDFGGAWFTLDGSINGEAGDDLRVLIGQFTTSGSVSGQISFQIFPHGEGSDAQLYTIEFGNPDCGCSDAEACNFDGYTVNDGSCTYPGVYDCDGLTCMNDTDDDGVCDENEVAGCTDADAVNYDSAATDDDGTCLLAGCMDPTALNFDPEANFNTGCILPMLGCTDPVANNYNALANTNDGTCEYESPCPGDINGDGQININDLLDFFQLYGSDCPE